MLDGFFGIRERGSSVGIELMAGLTTFLTAAYIIPVHSGMLAETGMDRGALITVTCLIAGLGTLLYGLWPRVPFMMAPGMGLNAFFTYTLCLGANMPWQTALGVVFVSGCLFLVLTVVGIREAIVNAIPVPLQVGTSVGIGLFITLIGLRNLGVVADHTSTLVTLGNVRETTVWMGLGGLVLIGVLEVLKVRGSLLIGILGVTGFSIWYGALPMPVGEPVALPDSIGPIALELDIGAALAIDHDKALKLALWAPIFSFMFVDLFDSLGTLMGVASRAGMVGEDGRIHKIDKMLGCDAVATVAGAVLGTSTTTTYIESASGITQGGRTGLTAVTTGVLFLAAMFFGPLIKMIPPYATAPALVVVGVFMMRAVKEVDFTRMDEALPVFLTIVIMPLTFSISNGIMFGFCSWVLIKLLTGRFRDVHPVLLVIAILSGIQLWAGAG